MGELITINNENLANYVMFKIDKSENSFTVEELNRIDEVVIDYQEEKDSNFIFLKELLKLEALKSLTIRHAFIYNDDFNVLLQLDNLNSITFEDCEFENADLIASLKLKSLAIYNCKFNNYLFINLLENLEELTLVNARFDMRLINNLNKLRYLQISYSTILDNVEIKIESIEELYMDNTNIGLFEFLNSLPNLKRLSIDDKQYNKNKELFEALKSKGVLVMDENMVEVGDINEV